MPYTAGYKNNVDSTTESQTFETLEEAQAWLDSIIETLPEPVKIQDAAPATETEPEKFELWECTWETWISLDNAG